MVPDKCSKPLLDTSGDPTFKQETGESGAPRFKKASAPVPQILQQSVMFSASASKL